MDEYNLIIIGGGAAGSFAACIASEAANASETANKKLSKPFNILIIERNQALMRKLGITGKGRCNLTNNTDAETCIKNFPTNGKFLYSALNTFTPADTMEYFEKLGVKLKTERGNRVFPQSDKAFDVVNALKNKIKELGVTVITDRAEEILTEKNKVIGVKCENRTYYADKVLLAAGGLSYSKTGSTGDGFRMAERLGHTVIAPKPSLVPIITVEDCSLMAGLSLKNITLSLFDNESKKDKSKPIFSLLGEILFTHFGMSGPLVLSASSYIKENKAGRYRLSIDLKPALSEEKLDARILRDFTEQINKQFQNSLNRLLPESLIIPFIERTGIPPEKRINEITREERRLIIKTLKFFDFTFASFRPIEEAVITDGGVSVKEINPSDMQSKLIKGLYFAGEIIDVTGFTGGFNLQAAFSTAFSGAYAAVISAAHAVATIKNEEE